MLAAIPGTYKVGIRALRQNLSAYLRRIGRERFEITDRGGGP